MIILLSQYGFGNRLRTIGSLYEISKLSGHRLLVIWPVEEDMNAKYIDLFNENEIQIISFKINRIFHNIFSYFFRYSRKIELLKTIIINGQFILSHSKEEQIKIYKKNRLILVRTCLESIQDYSLDIFKIKDEIIAKSILKYNYCINRNNLIGIHIRRTDNVWSTENSPLYLFIDRIKNELKKNHNTFFYLASDDPEEKKIIKKKFGDNIITENLNNYDRNSLDGIKNSVIDMYNLSCCHKIYGSYGSSFSEIASKIGKTELEIISDNENRESYQFVRNIYKSYKISLTKKEWVYYYLHFLYSYKNIV